MTERNGHQAAEFSLESGGYDFEVLDGALNVSYADGYSSSLAITQQPQDIWLPEGETAAFTVGVSGSKPQYQWQIRQGDDGTWMDIPGATQASYTTVALNLSDNGKQYRCVISNSEGSVTTDVARPGVLRIMATAAEIAAEITMVNAPGSNQTQLALPGVPDGYAIAIKNSSNPAVIDLDGVITPTNRERAVDLVFEITKELDGTKAVTIPIRVTVPPLPTELPDTAEEVADIIPSTITVVHDTTALPIPVVPDDFEISIVSVNPPGIIGKDGSITPPTEDTDVEIVFLIVDTRDNTVAYTPPIRVAVEGKTLFPLEGITLNPSHLMVREGDQGQFAVGFFPINTTDVQGVDYSVQPSGVLSVTADGRYAALKSGSAVVTATSDVGGYKAYCTVVVQEKLPDNQQMQGGQVESVAVTPESMNIAPGASAKLSATIAPQSAAENNPVAWTSSNTKVAIVAADGTVRGVSEGTAKITATAGGKQSVCSLTVANPVVKLLTPLKMVNLKVKSKATLPIVSYDKKGALKSQLTWSSSKPAVASVNAATGTITAKKIGTAKITATSLSGKKAVITVKVVKKAKAIKKIALTMPPKKMNVGKTKQLKLKLTPAGATYKTLTFRSSKPSVISVDKAGNLTAKKKGKAVITAKMGSRVVTRTIIVR
jgi:uncharacterized protein YjdB